MVMTIHRTVHASMRIVMIANRNRSVKPSTGDSVVFNAELTGPIRCLGILLLKKEREFTKILFTELLSPNRYATISTACSQCEKRDAGGRRRTGLGTWISREGVVV